MSENIVAVSTPNCFSESGLVQKSIAFAESIKKFLAMSFAKSFFVLSLMIISLVGDCLLLRNILATSKNAKAFFYFKPAGLYFFPYMKSGINCIQQTCVAQHFIFFKLPQNLCFRAIGLGNKIYCDCEENFVAEVKISHAKIMMSANAMMNRYRKNFFIKNKIIKNPASFWEAG